MSVRNMGAYFTGLLKSLKLMVSLMGFFGGPPAMYRRFHAAVNGLGLGFVAVGMPQNLSVSLMSVLLPWPRQSKRNTLKPFSDRKFASPSQSPLVMSLPLPGGYIRITTGEVPGSVADLWNRPR